MNPTDQELVDYVRNENNLTYARRKQLIARLSSLSRELETEQSCLRNSEKVCLMLNEKALAPPTDSIDACIEELEEYDPEWSRITIDKESDGWGDIDYSCVISIPINAVPEFKGKGPTPLSAFRAALSSKQ